ncbi:YetF domain-containing protein [Sporomusa aerivorans]|uniref:YetF domain-containing protein n=1 Tax=Sporomusa aerivorans TaxID=204936 RepID=UPI00352B95F5
MEWQEFLRDTWQTSLVFISLLLFTRILGKTQVGQLTFYEYVSGITIGSLAANIAAADADKVWNHYYDLILFVALTYSVSLVTIKSRPLRKLIDGSPTIVIENGRIIAENMHGLRYDLDELNGHLRQQGILDPAEVQYAILETTGDLSVIKKADYQPLTKSDFNIHLADPSFPVELIMDGVVIERNLRRQNRSQDWLEKQLAERNISDISQVTYAGIDSKGKLFVNQQTKSALSNNEHD